MYRNRAIRLFVIVSVASHGLPCEAADTSGATTSREILGRARKIMSISEWSNASGPSASHRLFYRWITPGQLLFVRKVSGSIRAFVQHDVGRDEDTELTGLGKSVYASLGGIGGAVGTFGGLPNGVEKFEVSQDGRIALWRTPNNITSALLDGSHVASWQPDPAKDSRKTAWIHGANKWICLLTDTPHTYPARARVHDVAEPDKHETYSLPKQAAHKVYLHSYYAKSDGKKLTINAILRSLQAKRTFIITKIQVYPTQTTLSRHTLHLPARVHLEYGSEIQFSPDGNKLAWLLYVQQPNNPPINVLWISKANGKSQQEIGWFEIPKTMDPSVGPKRMEWTPDGKNISFIFNGDLWEIPAS